MLHVLQAGARSIVGIFHIVGFRKINRHDEGCSGSFDVVDAFVLIATSFNDVAHAKLICDLIGTQNAHPVGGIKDLGQFLILNPRFERLIGKGAGVLRTKPFGIQVGLTQHGYVAHHGAGVVL